MEFVRQDLRMALRAALKHRGFTFVVVLTLALGIGANTAIFSAVDGVLLKPLPYTEADRIVTLWQHDSEHGIEEVAPANFLDWRERSRSLDAMAAIEPFSFDHLGSDGPVAIPTWRVSEGFFEILGTPALLGRTFLPDEYGPGDGRVVVLSHALWRDRFGGDRDLVGRTLTLDGEPVAVVGVMPPEFRFPAGGDLWSPKSFNEREAQNRTSAYFQVIGRLAPGATLASAGAELAGIAEQLGQEHPRTNTGQGIAVVGLREHLVGSARPALLALLGAVGLVLLIACVNVANLMLVRAAAREREFAIRTALGASTGRTIRQLFAESLILTSLGGAAGVLLAEWGIRALRLLGPPGLARLEAIAVDGRVLAFTVLVTLLTAVLFALAPAVHLRRRDVQRSLRATGLAVAGKGGAPRFRGALVIGQLALAMVLLVGAGLLLRSFVALLAVEPGYRVDNVLTASVQAWQYYPTGAARAAFVEQTVDRLSALPGVEAAGVTSSLPLAEGIGAETASFEIDGREPVASDAAPTAHAAAVTTGYLQALRVPLRSGRLFEARDGPESPPVVMISESFARRHFPGDDPVGQYMTVRFAGPPVRREVVGVVGDMRHGGLMEEPRATLYVPHTQAPTGAVSFVVRSAAEPLAMVASVQEEIWRMNRLLPISRVTTLDALLADSMRERRLSLLLVLGFSLAALFLGAIGIYGLLSHETGRRNRELGVRLALGAERGRVLRMVLGEGALMAAAGVAAGSLLALGATRVLGAFLYGVERTDPLTFGGIAVLLSGVALLAAYLPARRAARVDPIVALRSE